MLSCRISRHISSAVLGRNHTTLTLWGQLQREHPPVYFQSVHETWKVRIRKRSRANRIRESKERDRDKLGSIKAFQEDCQHKIKAHALVPDDTRNMNGKLPILSTK